MRVVTGDFAFHENNVHVIVLEKFFSPVYLVPLHSNRLNYTITPTWQRRGPNSEAQPFIEGGGAW